MKASPNHLLIAICLFISLPSISQVKDQDGNTYKTVKIGEQTWMAENLNVSKFRNGDVILEAKTPEEWIQAGESGKPAWCYYGNDPANGKPYGKLYNWAAVTDPRGLAPKGWHIPADEEWEKLVIVAGGEKLAGTALKSKEGWQNKTHDDPHGFNGLPGGSRNSSGEFSSLTTHGHCWTSTPINATGYSRGLSAAFAFVGHPNRNLKATGLSVRCVKD